MLDAVLPPTPVILVVDDQASNVHLLREAVRDLGEVYFAMDGEAALHVARQVLPDVILLDIGLPGMDGFAVCRAIKDEARLAGVAIIFVTAHTSVADEIQALEAGAQDFLHKPLNLPVARARIRTHLALRQQGKQLALARHNLEDLINHLPAFIAYWDAGLRCLFSNDRHGEWFGIPAPAMAGQALAALLGTEMAALIDANLPAVLAGQPCSFDIALASPQGEARHAHATLLARFSADVCCGFLLLLVDISERKRAEAALFEEKERMRVMLHSIGDAVIATDTQGRVTFVNPIAEALTGWQECEAIGAPIEAIMPLRDGSDDYDLQNPIRLALQEGRVVGMALNCKLRRRDGELFDVEDSAAPIRNQQGRLIGTIIVFHDVSEARAMAVKMTHLAYHDALTNLPNRLLLQDRILQALQQAIRNETRVAMLLLDLDSFKSINDSIGHATGDTLLQQLAQRLLAACSPGDTVSRQGGDEFILLLPEVTSLEAVGDFSQLLLERVAEPFWLGQHRYDLSGCIGISLYPDDSADAEELYRHADSAMHRAKQEGRQRVRFFSADIEHSMRARHLMEQHMRHALEEGIFRVYYQAKVDARQQRITGVEALIRWCKADGSLVSPAEFIPLAEETGLIVPIGKYVLQQACEDAVAWHARGFEVAVSVNISAVQFREAGFLAMVQQALQDSGIRPKLLELEITEGVLAQDIRVAQELLQDLRELGVRMAIDDFGTGYSSLSYLKSLPVDVLKIDQSFVREMLHSSREMAIVEAIVKLGSTLNLQLVAEGVETEAQMLTLLAMGCDIIQGFYYCRPLTGPDMSDFLQTGLPAQQGRRTG
ncbi:two-component system response regulator [Chitinilyticum litopenaei]|uniref:two-component system response regulator n=1 Tax=Chitinilyticum litopenaei TaxID=1121276 RepID=UPI0003F7218C|nr:EAL domain-containing protein [Chitinilyticum litopenaei]